MIHYRACLTCGRLMPLHEGAEQVYCSPECAQVNLRCPVCGRYYREGTGVIAPWGDEVCRPECAQTDERFTPLFKETP